MKLADVPVLPTKVIVDVFEPDLVHIHLVELGVGYRDKLALPFGDYWIRKGDGGLVSIERKHKDLAQDWPYRLHRQLTKAMKGGADEVVLLVEGVLNTDNVSGRLELPSHVLRKVWYTQVWTTILRWQYDFGLKVYQCPIGSVHVARAVQSMYKYYHAKGGQEKVLRTKKLPLDKNF